MKASIADAIVVIALFYMILCIPGQIDYAVECGEELNDVSIAIQTVVATLMVIIGMKMGGGEYDEYSNL